MNRIHHGVMAIRVLLVMALLSACVGTSPPAPGVYAVTWECLNCTAKGTSPIQLFNEIEVKQGKVIWRTDPCGHPGLCEFSVGVIEDGDCLIGEGLGHAALPELPASGPFELCATDRGASMLVEWSGEEWQMDAITAPSR